MTNPICLWNNNEKYGRANFPQDIISSWNNVEKHNMSRIMHKIEWMKNQRADFIVC